MVQHENAIIPIEVKSDENVKSRSLNVYRQKYNPEISVRYSLRNLQMKDGLINIPLFLADYTSKLLRKY